MTAVKIKNILADIPTQLPTELFTCLLKNEQVQIERIVSRGQASAKDEWYDQVSDEWVLLLQGEAILAFSEPQEFKKLQAGDYLLIPAHCKHRVDWTLPDRDSIWLAVHLST
ncbi:MAG: phosphoribosylaminoimidazole carboxylase [Methyloprofundus sp.]|nr:phosphoribosylaminoimidazole carboxylase [Methyloprofundus sp.]